ncbi:translation initiation factor IF-2-like [Mustela erminea]|uniref:translation initiation factor IF-2-like n=1 Tax=Mustela erminea TaxID=36723 RepID=UPI001386E043|nr:translation initiation factor IF-2-like [Mustela erminea]
MGMGDKGTRFSGKPRVLGNAPRQGRVFPETRSRPGGRRDPRRRGFTPAPRAAAGSPGARVRVPLGSVRAARAPRGLAVQAAGAAGITRLRRPRPTRSRPGPAQTRVPRRPRRPRSSCARGPRAPVGAWRRGWHVSPNAQVSSRGLQSDIFAPFLLVTASPTRVSRENLRTESAAPRPPRGRRSHRAGGGGRLPRATPAASSTKIRPRVTSEATRGGLDRDPEPPQPDGGIRASSAPSRRQAGSEDVQGLQLRSAARAAQVRPGHIRA